MDSPKLPAALLAAFLFTTPGYSGVTVKEEPDRIRVEIDGQLFTNYVFAGAPHVYFFPVCGPGGVKMTRSWPMEEVPGEEHDHPHHRSLWFAHGNVNGIDFWTETNSHRSEPSKPPGRIEHRKFLELKSGDNEGVIRDLLEWIAPDGSVTLSSEQTIRVYRTPASERIFDYEMALLAGEKAVVFGDTKEGTLGFRLAESMRLTRSDKTPGQGLIFNETGLSGQEVWGKRAAWVDMAGPVDGKTVGVAIFDHPSNFRHPTRWHARDYGLFAANPFCEHEMDPARAKGSGAYTLPAGQRLVLRYRFYLHEGDAKQADVAGRYTQFLQEVP